MPIALRKLSFKNYINKLLNSKQFDKMIYLFATPEQPGYKYLHFFKEEDQAAAATDYKVKPTRNDELKAFDIEILQ
ncbi:17990_t:CDS:2 [Cetraspora pellucida]|uniref:17990_t:CDS:1 n=1 Tax=Cetraspora pellucida TaxID=1433469 RepID=A0ACA9LIL8_9GLOM|nr:17990_t:CDS:2 [Cetraspora pellucida]